MFIVLNAVGRLCFEQGGSVCEIGVPLAQAGACIFQRRMSDWAAIRPISLSQTQEVGARAPLVSSRITDPSSREAAAAV
jgi:hypothetical protein